MFSRNKKKYRLLPKESVMVNDVAVELHRIQALIDIPLHGIKEGDIGGYVSHKSTLSQEGSAWLDKNAMAVSKYAGGGPIVAGDALATDEALIRGSIGGNVKVFDKAVVNGYAYGDVTIRDFAVVEGNMQGNVNISGNVKIVTATITARINSTVNISGDVVINCPVSSPSYDPGANSDRYFIECDDGEEINISGKLTLNKVVIRGNCKLDGEFNLEGVSFTGDNVISGQPKIKPEVKFSGHNVITGDSMIPPGSHVHDVVMNTGILNYSSPGFSEPVNASGASTDVSVSQGQVDSIHLDLIHQIEAEYEAYTTDIVKLIKYPAMVDTSIPEVRDFTVKLRSVKRAAKTASEEKLAELSEALETAFVCAENKVQTLVASHLDEGKKKALKDAEKMFKLACDDASPEPEKKLGFKAGMRSLEGVIVVSEKATENMKARIGILELEA